MNSSHLGCLQVVVPEPPEWEVEYQKFKMERLAQTNRIYDPVRLYAPLCKRQVSL